MSTETFEDLTNIYYNKKAKHYYVHKMVHGDRRYYGCYKTLKEAIKRRDELREQDWQVKGNKRHEYRGVDERIARMYGIQEEDIP